MEEAQFQPPPDAAWISAVREAVREEIYNHNCRLAGVSDEDLKSIGTVVDMISSLGEGNTKSGVEVMRTNHNWLVTQRERTEQFGRTFFFVVITSAVGGAALALWAGVKALVAIK